MKSIIRRLLSELLTRIINFTFQDIYRLLTYYTDNCIDDYWEGGENTFQFNCFSENKLC